MYWAPQNKEAPYAASAIWLIPPNPTLAKRIHAHGWVKTENYDIDWDLPKQRVKQLLRCRISFWKWL
jgi:hypothetical protein